MEISVVIPLYNKEKYIYRTLQSVLKQTVPPTEIVVIDDGSTDTSVKEVRRIQDSRIHLICQQNSGEGATRNRGVQEAKYELVAFLDADDEWHPDFLLHIQRLRNNFPDCGLYATAYEIINPNGSVFFPQIMEVPPAPWVGIIPNLFRMVQEITPFCASSVAIPKKVFQDLNGFPEGIVQGADQILWIQIGMKYPIAFSPSRQAVYHREAENRVCNTFVPEPAAAKFLERKIQDNEIPNALLADVSDYYASLLIRKARLAVFEGQGKLARDLLSRIKINQKYRRQIAWWYFWSLVPNKIINNIQHMRSE